MYLEQLYLKNFRSYQSGQAEFTPGTNVIYGPNATGKTNMLEAVYLCATARSHRMATNRELIYQSDGQMAQNARIIAKYNGNSREQSCEIRLFPDKKKQIRLNNVPVAKTSDLMGHFKAVLFCPEDLQIVKGAPRMRRRLIDLGLSQMRANYFHTLSCYNRVLEQKNKLLKTGGASAMLETWNERLAHYGAEIIWYRLHYMQKLARHAAQSHFEIAGEQLGIKYVCGVGGTLENKEQIKLNFLNEIERSFDREVRQGMSIVGPHRDDFLISINGYDAREYASQGQQRTAALAVKMAEVAIIFDEGEAPVLLLDDVLSELDANRQRYILQNRNDMQVIITCCETAPFKGSGSANLIEVGKIYGS